MHLIRLYSVTITDCVQLQMYKDSKVRCKKGPTKASLSLERIVAIESDFTLDKESNTLAIICTGLVVVLAFDSRETLIQWQVKIGYHVPEGNISITIFMQAHWIPSP